MNDGPLKDFWETSKGVKINKDLLDKWAEQAISFSNENGYGYVRSGDSIVLAFKNDDEGIIEVFDCQVRRTARIKHE